MTLFDLFSLTSYIVGKFPQGGALPPSRFNQLLPMVQDEIYNAAWKELVAASVSPAVYDKVLSKTPLLPFKKYVNMTAGPLPGQSYLPADYSDYISVYTKWAGIDNADGPRVRKFEIVNDEQFTARQNSIFTRADIKPFAKITDDSIMVVPFDLNEDFTMDYLRRPSTPVMDYCVDALSPTRILYMPVGSRLEESQVAGQLDLSLGEVVLQHNVLKDGQIAGYQSQSVELEWDAKDHWTFVYKILAKCAVNLGEGEAEKFALMMDK